MSRCFVIVSELFTLITDIDRTFSAGYKAHGRRWTGRYTHDDIAIGRTQRIAPERVLEIGKQQLLMLLLVL